MAKISTYPIISVPTLNDLLIGTDVENLNETKNFSIAGITNLILVDSYVPYVDATKDVDLGIHTVTGAGYIVNGGAVTDFLKADGSLDSTVYVPETRTLTINGETYNLSADRSWDINSIDSLTTIGTSGAATYIGKVLNIPVYQPQGDYITQLSGEATGSGPGNASVTLDNTAVISKVLTGLNVTGGNVVDTDTILQAFGKVQNQINGLVGGVQYQGTWNAATNTPFLQSSVGEQGYYYVVSVAGNTNLNGITDWQLGDWAIYDGTAWQKVDNTDAVVSVNGYTGAVVLTYSDVGAVPTGRTLTINGVGYDLSLDRAWTVGDVRTDQSYINPSWIVSLDWGKITSTPTTLAGYGITDGALNTTTLTINGTTYDLTENRTWSVGTVTSIATTGPLTGGTITGSGTIGITQAGASTDGYLSSTDWNAFNNKQEVISVTAPLTFVAGVVGITQSGAATDGYLSSVDWNTFNNKVAGSGTANTLPMWGSSSSLVNSPLSYAADTFNFQYNSATGGAVVFTNSNGAAYAYTIQMNNFGSPRSTVHSYTDGLIIQSIGGTQVSRMFANGNLILGGGFFDNGYKLEITGSLFVNSIANATTDTDRFLVSDGGALKYRTGSEVLSDIGAVPTTRTLTINGTAFDLSADRSWSVGTVTSVDMSVPSGFAIAGNPVTGAGTLALSFASGFSLPSNAMQATWDTAYNNSIVSAAVTGTTTKTLTLNQQDGGTVTASWTDIAPVTSVFGRIGDILAQSGDYTTTLVTEGTNLYFTDSRARQSISLTTTGTNGPATYSNVTGVFNIPDYGSVLTGYVPYTGANQTVNLNTQQLQAGHTTLTTNGSTETLTINHTSGSGKAINVTKGGNGEGLYINKTSGSGNAATIVGTLEATTLVKTGGTSAQFLKADGSVDSTTYQNTADKGQPNGYASLDGNGKVPLTQINDALIGNVNFQGLWNASTNTPTLANPPSSGTKGYYYIVSTGGTFAGITFEVGDWIISNGTAWGKVDNTDAVSSVFGRTGNVVASNGDYNTSQVTESGNLYYTDARSRAALSFAAGSGAYNSGTGVITIPTNNNQITNGAGYITSAALAGYLPLTGGTLTGALNGTSASFTGVVSTLSSTTNGFLAQTNASSVHPYFRWVANNRSYWAAAIDSGTDATLKIGSGNTIGSSSLFTIDSGTNASTFTTTLAVTGAATFSSSVGVSVTPAAVSKLQVNVASNVSFSIRNAVDVSGAAVIQGITDIADENIPLEYRASKHCFMQGNVGIGTTNPPEKLQIGGNLNFYTGDGDKKIYFRSNGAVADTNWQMGTYNSPTGATVVTAVATTIDVYGSGGNTFGFMVRNTLNQPLLQIGGGTGAATFSSSVTATAAYISNANFTEDATYFDIDTFGGKKLRLNNAGNQLIMGTSGIVSIGSVGNNGSGAVLQVTGAATFSNSVTANSFIKSGGTSSQFLKADGSVDSTTYVPTSRTITINGTTQDLSANRTFNVGTVTSITATAGTGISISGSPITSSGTLNITNTAPDQIVSLTASTGISISGTYPNFTITNTSPSSGGTVTSVTASSPLASSGGTTPNITIQQASGSQSGFLSSTDWTTFNNKQNALTNPVTGTGTTNYLPKFTGASTIGNSLVFDNGTNVGIGTIIPQRILTIYDTNSATLYQTPTSGTTANSGFYVGQTGNVSYLYNYNNFPIVLATNSVESVRLFETSQNVHIGPTPASDNGARLQVSGTGRFTDIVTVISSSSTGYVAQTTANSVYPYFRWIANNRSYWAAAIDSGTDATFKIGGGNTIGSSPFLTIDSGTNASTFTTTLAVTGAATFSSTVAATQGNFTSAPSLGGHQIQAVSNSGGNTSYGGVLLLSSTGKGAYLTCGDNSVTTFYGAQASFISLGGTAGVGMKFRVDADDTKGITIPTSGNVGIGTPIPDAKLDIIGPSAASSPYLSKAIQFAPSNFPTRTWSLNYDDGGTLGNGFNISAGSTRILYLNANGNVGIGTASPSTLFNVSGYQSANWITTINNTGTSGHNLYFGYNNGTSTTYGLYITGGRGAANQLDFAVENKFYVNGNGNVLIGTTTDNGARLQVSGNVFLTDGANQHLKIQSSTGDYSYLFLKGGSNDGYLLQNFNGSTNNNVSAGAMYFYMSNSQQFEFNWGGVSKIQFTSTGAATFSSSVTASNFITTSDRRLKSEIKEIKNAISILSKFSSYEYVKDGKQDAGFIAQEVKEVIPYSVFENNDDILTMSDRPILAYIHKAILELNERINKLEK